MFNVVTDWALPSVAFEATSCAATDWARPSVASEATSCAATDWAETVGPEETSYDATMPVSLMHHDSSSSPLGAPSSRLSASCAFGFVGYTAIYYHLKHQFQFSIQSIA